MKTLETLGTDVWYVYHYTEDPGYSQYDEVVSPGSGYWSQRRELYQDHRALLAETGDNPKDNWGWTQGSALLLKIFDDMLKIPELS